MFYDENEGELVKLEVSTFDIPMCNITPAKPVIRPVLFTPTKLSERCTEKAAILCLHTGRGFLMLKY